MSFYDYLIAESDHREKLLRDKNILNISFELDETKEMLIITNHETKEVRKVILRDLIEQDEFVTPVTRLSDIM